jgi:hypothetical protein
MGGCNKGFSIDDVAPAVGVMAGNEPVKIRGSGFDPQTGYTVYFGTSKSPHVVVSGSDSITATTPTSEKPGAVDVRVLTDSGEEYLLRRAFRYIEKADLDIRDFGQRRSQREKGTDQ